MNASLLAPATATSYIGKCKTKGCKTALRVDDITESCRSSVSVFVWADEGRDAAEPETPYCIGNYGAYARCAQHGLYPLRTLKGRYNEDKGCDGRCINATGPNCECQCGGKNHGAGHAH